MANLASIKNALQIFKTTNATKWVPKTNLKNATEIGSTRLNSSH